VQLLTKDPKFEGSNPGTLLTTLPFLRNSCMGPLS
jgi:hypothetical protein